MSRVGKKIIIIPSEVTITISDNKISTKGTKGTLEFNIPNGITILNDRNNITIRVDSTLPRDRALSGTVRSIINNMIIGVSNGYEKRLQLVGVGYRAQVQGNKLLLSLGFSHPIEFTYPKEIVIETPSSTEVIIKGSSKELVGEIAAKIRAYRPPEPYKGKGVRYNDESVIIKEAKKK